jgi:2-polyprenyl-3-methyl-5-hydroxy-6-metoxy-1,4-benzoquinol methylase
MKISPEEKTILGIINTLEHQKTLPTLETISASMIWDQQKSNNQILLALDRLLNKEMVSMIRGQYSLTKQGLAQVKQYMSEGFSSILVAADESATSHKFCEQVFGLNLCQFDSMSMTQLNKLLDVLNLNQNDHILDLGCGVGKISEYISDITGARVLGIDYATGAINRAKERTLQKRDRISYQVMDMDELNVPEKSFSCLISIDAIHFVNDIKRTIQLSQDGLINNAQMGIFYPVTLAAGEQIDKLAPENTPLAEALLACGLNFQYWDFTKDEIGVWEKVLQSAEELKSDYEKEGKTFLYEMALSDAEPMLDAIRNGRRRRYLYHVQHTAAQP